MYNFDFCFLFWNCRILHFSNDEKHSSGWEYRTILLWLNEFCHANDMQWFTWEPSVWIRFYSFYSKSSNLIHSNKKLGTGLLNVVISQRFFFLVWRFQHTDKSLYGFHVNLWIYPVQEQHFKHFAHHRIQNLHTRELWEISKSPHTRWIPRFQTLNT